MILIVYRFLLSVRRPKLLKLPCRWRGATWGQNPDVISCNQLCKIQNFTPNLGNTWMELIFDVLPLKSQENSLCMDVDCKDGVFM